ncbi:hypothetical protein MES5069_60040 [Mesorhizobium escarrei]|uniref:Uncharacterized protein n=1 Tax=Mesorhizobium escarrei TaxID=666018 RepID=A0ABM9EDJ7_9HYPH|nr:hypothetical protein MES5069_60040 [Mesorhizobium escarrei]
MSSCVQPDMNALRSAGHKSGAQRVGPFRPSRLFGLPRCRLMVIVDGDGFEAVGAARPTQFDDTVACMRRALLGDMRRWRVVAISGAADAARIEDHRAVGDTDQFAAVAVATQHDAASGIERGQPPLDGDQRRAHQPAVDHRIGQVLFVMVGSRMKGGHGWGDLQRQRQGQQCLALGRRQPFLRMAIGWSHGFIGGVAGDAAVVVAAHRRQGERFKPLHGFARPERAGDAITEIDHKIGAAALPQIVEHGVQGEDVAVDIGENGNAHGNLRRVDE